MHGHEHEDQPGRVRTTAPRADDDRAAPVVARALEAGRAELLGAAGLTYLQRTAGNASTAGLVDEDRSPVLDVLSSGGGQPLDTDVRADMEGRLGHDFGDVRVHTDAAAADSAGAVGAHAYTVGRDVVFQRDAYDPASQAGRTTLAHELTHVVQQRSGPVDGTATGDGVRVSDPSDRFETAAAANAERAMAAPAPPTADALAPAATVQREAVPEDEEQLQGSFVQREQADDEELDQT